MTVWTALYTLLIGPLELLFETIFSLVNRHVSNPGLAIIFLSLCVNLLVLPLYRRADRLQAEERDLEEKLKPGADHIKAVFKGDERFMMMQTFYRQNHYKPVYALKGTLSLLLEIPFFIAAYHFLSNLKLLHGASIGPIRDLALTDGLLTVSGFTINVLPILMTLINILSAAIYMKGYSFRNKLQMYGMSLIFLVLLYDSPSGLAFYWTLNNLFSLCKNIFYKLENPGKVLRRCGITACILGLAGIDWLLIRNPKINVRIAGYLAGAALCLLVLLVLLVKLRKPGHRSIPPADQMDSRIFWSSGVFMILLTGVLIPSAVLKSSPEEFTTVVNYHSPLWNLLSCFLLAAGTFGVWFGIFYKIAAPVGKTLMSRGFFCLAVISVINYLFFGTHRGTLSPTLVIIKPPSDTVREVLINLLILLEAVLLFYFLLRMNRTFVLILMSSLCLAAGIMSGLNTVSTARVLAGIEKNIALRASVHPEIHLSKNGKNVVILMMDRSIGYYMSYLMAEKPELRQKFDGFTYYPNTISFGSATNSALPAVYGGYEYTTEKLNERSDTPLRVKHNEALLLMPTLFSGEGYRVTLFDPSYANYSPDSDLSIYDDLPNTTAYATSGLFVSPEYTEAVFNVRNRNFFCYSLYKTAPLLLQPMIYTGGLYNNPDDLAGFNGEKMGMQR
ncbi:MAG: membrane protein insertase YidC, partial [Anaerolineaceae bacterium]|nr:membrane protein insertase YidC [Anaerolineaceae bacterium]